MKQRLLRGFVLILVLLSLADAALAHSTKGRKKIDLDAARPTTDDFAYFMESYVVGELYRDREPKWESRYYVKEFKSLDVQGNTAVVGFLTLDTKTNGNFADSMRFERGDDGIWYYVAADGNRHKVYTYVTTSVYYSKKYGRLVSGIGLIGAVACLVLLVQLRRRRRVRSAEQEREPAPETAPSDNRTEAASENEAAREQQEG
ncbi:MAG: hypothetical protein ACOX5Z_05125 [Desulfobulbus sp.]|jgi:hypothetical protein